MPDCPICGKPASPRTTPFCSSRCANIDLGRWFTGAYRIPIGPEEADSLEQPGADPATHDEG